MFCPSHLRRKNRGWGRKTKTTTTHVRRLSKENKVHQCVHRSKPDGDLSSPFLFRQIKWNLIIILLVKKYNWLWVRDLLGLFLRARWLSLVLTAFWITAASDHLYQKPLSIASIGFWNLPPVRSTTASQALCALCCMERGWAFRTLWKHVQLTED